MGKGVKKLFPFLSNVSETVILKQNLCHKNENMEYLYIQEI